MKEVEDHDVLFVLPKCLNRFEIEYRLTPISRDGTATSPINFKGSTCQILQCTPLNLALTCLPGLDGLWRLLSYLFSRNSDPRW